MRTSIDSTNDSKAYDRRLKIYILKNPLVLSYLLSQLKILRKLRLAWAVISGNLHEWREEIELAIELHRHGLRPSDPLYKTLVEAYQSRSKNLKCIIIYD
jgi:hypothetical protein